VESSNSKQFKPIIFVSGKGGVGKSVISASLADHLSKKGKKVLLVELGDKSFFEKFFQLNDQGKHIGFQPTEIKSNLFISIWDFRAVLKEYVSHYIKSEKLYDLFFGNQMMQKLIQTAPALKELAILGKATSGPRQVGPKLDYDHVIVDSYSTGHHKALLKAPRGISQAIRKGPMGVQSESMIKVMQNPELCQQIIVIKPEELPTVEGLELKNSLKAELNLDSTIVCNQILEFPLTEDELNKESSLSDGENQEMSEYFSKIYEEQKTCLKQLWEADSSYIPVKFCFKNSDKFEFISELGKSFPESTR
jgi:anion-transporting  ArsA/GET3 family ATPase